MYEFCYCDNIEKLWGNKSKLFFADTDSFRCEIKTKRFLSRF